MKTTVLSVWLCLSSVSLLLLRLLWHQINPPMPFHYGWRRSKISSTRS